jgi:hypothetical protein
MGKLSERLSFGIIAESMCSIPVEKLKPEPAKDNRKPLLDE